MTALTPGCDPDMSTTGAPFGAVPASGSGVRSGLVLMVVAVGSAFLAIGDAVPGVVTVPAVVIGGSCALALVRRGVRAVQRPASAAAAPLVPAVHRSRPVPTALP